ncbi:MAG: hypoxanthine phosphoribosyltransferase [Anaerolineae bacterium]|nr:hypoxanthine phosphoribosyltransferase [Anaerolineae bacterium]
MTDQSSADWPGEIGTIYLTEDEIQQRVTQLGAEISRDYAGQDLILIGVLTGVFIFMADLLRAMTIPVTVDFLALSRYGPSEQTHGVVRLTKDLDETITGRHVLFVEDIIDTGFTTRFIMHNLQLREPASCRVCTLLNRPRRRIIDIELDYIGFDMPDYFVVGYGLDYDERYRNLPYLVRVDPDQLKQE